MKQIMQAFVKGEGLTLSNAENELEKVLLILKKRV